VELSAGRVTTMSMTMRTSGQPLLTIDDAILANLSCGLLRRMFRIFWVLRRNAIDAFLSVEV
jgi:hypothetical protein